MAVAKNLTNAFVPIRERREVSGTLASVNAELVMPLNGDANVLIIAISTSFVGTLEFTSASDAGTTTFLPIPTYPIAAQCVGGTIPLSAQPLFVDALVALNTIRVYSIPAGQVKALRIRAVAWTSGSIVLNMVADANPPLNTAIETRPYTLIGTQTGAAGAAVTLTLLGVAGMRHVLDRIVVVRSATTALTASATPVVITTTNIPGALALTLGQDVAGIGVDKETRWDAGGTGLATLTLGTNTTIVCPAYTGVIWRVTAGYRLGL